MNAGPDQHVDHRDHNGLNNQRSNLRLASKGQNNRNARKRIDGLTSKYKGVHRKKKHKIKMWCARIQIDGVRKSLGYFTTEEEAAQDYDTAAVEFFGEFAFTNFPILPDDEG